MGANLCVMPLPGRPSARLLLALAAGAVAVPAGAGDPRPPGPFAADRALLAGRMRVTGQPGDLALENPAAVAVVRRSDGWLVDFWPTTPVAATAPQLAGLTAIDGLWLMHPVVVTARAVYALTAETVRTTADAVETVSTVDLGAGRLEVVTSYQLDPTAPRIVITTRARHAGGGRLAAVSIGDVVKWGNVDYFVDGVGRAGERFSGHARWVGRKGASGDLVLTALDASPMRLDFKTLQHGLAPQIDTLYATQSIGPGETMVVRRSLAYTPIADAPPLPVPTGTIDVSVRDEAGHALAAKLSLRGLHGMRDPDFGNDGDLDGAGRFVWSGTGHFTRALPVGSYSVLATAGIERDAASWTVDVKPGGTTTLAGKLPRVIDTPGWISGDLHLHQAASVDADVACSARVIAVAAEGVELAVATDHYVVTDLAPVVKALEQSGKLASGVLAIRGTELSPVGKRFGHFGFFPLPADASIGYTNTTPRRMFGEARAADPDGLLTANHPRWADIGYFHYYKLDPKTARVPYSSASEYDPDFDAIEVFNGADQTSLPKVRQVLYDWLHLLGAGHRYTATGNSDSHKLFFLDPGVPRNMIHYGTAESDADDIHADPASIVRALHQGRVVVTSGPVLDVDVNGQGPGETVKASGKHVPLHIRVRAAPWIDVSSVEVLLGGKGRRIRFIGVPASRSVVRLDTTIDVQVPGPTFVVVLARGKRALPNVFSPGVYPFAFTNPIWLQP